MAPPSVRFYAPDARLRPYLTAYYYVEFPPGEPVEDLLMPEWSGVRFALRGAWSASVGGPDAPPRSMPVSLFGHTSRTGLIRCETPGLGLGVGILPLGWTEIVRLPAADYVDRMVDAAEAFGDEAARVFDELAAAEGDQARNAILDRFFFRRIEGRPPPSETLLKAHAVLNDPAVGTTEAFAAALGVSVRQAARLSETLFGFPPKLLLRRQRFLRTLGAIRDNLNQPWAEQLDPWYYDQSHFVRDFHDFMGMSPSAYFSSKGVLLAAAGQARARALGQSLQGLDAPKTS
jgi:AraC-like DNA-binding protein